MTPAFEALADDALLVRLGQTIDPTLNRQALALADALREAAPDWLRDVVPAYASVAVFFDPVAWQDDAHAQVQRWIEGHLDNSARTARPAAARAIELPVCYGGAYGQDLDSAAAELGLSPESLIARHTAGRYTVAMTGFAPGFPYLLGLDAALALPRLATPRARVPAGSVAIGGAQTGVYPRESPGGWRLLGRTPLRLFDATRATPALLSPGDVVRFVAISPEQFEASGR